MQQSAIPQANAAAHALSSPAERRTRRIVVALAVATLTLALAGVLTWLFVRHRARFPLAIGKLPKELISVGATETSQRIAGPLFMRSSDVPEQARWSFFGHAFCGGPDLFHDLVHAGNPSGVDDLAALILDKDGVRMLLSCGKAIADGVAKDKPIYTLTLNVGGSPQSLEMVEYRGADLPEVPPFLGVVTNPKHLEKTRRGSARRPRDTDRWAVAKIAHEPLWVSGDIAVLESFGDGFSVDGSNTHSEGELLAACLDAAPGRSTAAGYGTTDLEEGDEPNIIEPLNVIGYVTDDAVRTRAEKATHSVRLWSQEIGERDGFSQRHAEYTTKSDGDAKELEDALDRYVRAARLYEQGARSMLQSHRQAPHADENDEDRAWIDLTSAIEDARTRGLGQAKVSRHGSKVTLDCDDAPDVSDVAAAKAFADLRHRRSARAAAVIDALIAGRASSEEDEKALSPELSALLHIPESVTFEEFGGLPIPGGATCGRRDEWFECSYEKWDRRTTLGKMRSLAEKAGYSWSETVSKEDDVVVTVVKGGVARTFRIFGPRDHSAPTVLSLVVKG